MRHVRYGVAASLDGYIAGPNGEYDWITQDPDIDFAAMFAQYDAALVGRKTYELVRRHCPLGLETYVFSRTLRQADCPGVIVSDQPADVVRDLKSRGGKDIWLFGGGVLFRELLDLGLVDAVDVAIVPVLLGGGVRLLPEPAKLTRLALTGHRLYGKSGIVRLEYRVGDDRHRRGSGRDRS